MKKDIFICEGEHVMTILQKLTPANHAATPRRGRTHENSRKLGGEINHAPVIPLFFDFECIKLIIELKHKEQKMKKTLLCLLLLSLALFAAAALATPDSLDCRMIDWLDMSHD
jgi:hypothetical protein